MRYLRTTGRCAAPAALVAMADEVFDVARVAQNPYPAALRPVTCDADRLVFENPAHDFPRRIEYRLIGEDALEAHVCDRAARGFRLKFSRAPAEQSSAA